MNVVTMLRHNVRGAVAGLRINLLVAAQYRVDHAIWALVNALQTVVYLSVWRAVAESTGGSTVGFTAGEFAGYFVVLLVVRELVMAYTLIGPVAMDVRTGLMSTKLLRPVHPLVYHLGRIAAFRLQGIIVIALAAPVLFLAFDATVDVRPVTLLLMVAIVPLALAAKLLADCIVACSAMWLTRIDGIRGIYSLVLLLLGGQLAPIDLFPDWLAAVARSLPFYWMLGFPSELLIGRAELSQTWTAAAVLGAWSIVLYVLLQPVWRAGTRAYEAVGS